jgi:hypothetical protein
LPTSDQLAAEVRAEDAVVLIHRAPQGMALAVDGQKHCIQVPFVPGLRATAKPPIGVVLPKLTTPCADSFVGHGNAAFAQEFLHIAIAQGEAIGEPDTVANDCSGKAAVFVTLGVAGRGMSRYLSWCATGHRGDIARAIMSWLRQNGQQVDHAIVLGLFVNRMNLACGFRPKKCKSKTPPTQWKGRESARQLSSLLE